VAAGGGRENELGGGNSSSCGVLQEHQAAARPPSAPNWAAQRALGPQAAAPAQLQERLNQTQTALGPPDQDTPGRPPPSCLTPLNSELAALEAEAPGPRRRQTATAGRDMQHDLEAATGLLSENPPAGATPCCRPARALPLARERLPNTLRGPRQARRAAAAAGTWRRWAKRTGKLAPANHQQENRSGRRALEAPAAALQERFRRTAAAARERLRPSSPPSALALQQQQWASWSGWGELLALGRTSTRPAAPGSTLGRELPDPLPVFPSPYAQAGPGGPGSKNLRRLQNAWKRFKRSTCSPLKNSAAGDRPRRTSRPPRHPSKEREELLAADRNRGQPCAGGPSWKPSRRGWPFPRDLRRPFWKGGPPGNWKNPEQPLEGGLTLVAHPRGRRCAAGPRVRAGEKSLYGPQGFCSPLQRFRPSPLLCPRRSGQLLDGGTFSPPGSGPGRP